MCRNVQVLHPLTPYISATRVKGLTLRFCHLPSTLLRRSCVPRWLLLLPACSLVSLDWLSEQSDPMLSFLPPPRSAR